MAFEQSWLEHDYNPFILFNQEGKIISLNTEAQFLLGYANSQEIFKLTQTYASITFGFKTTFIELEYGRYKFFGITVGYEDEKQIGIKLYQTPSFKHDTKKPEGNLTNIFTLLDLCISSHSINTTTRFTKDYDPTIPDVIIDSRSILKLLNKAYDFFKQSNTITTRVFFRVGEHIKFEGKKYSIFSISIQADINSKNNSSDIKYLAEKHNYFVDVNRDKIVINLPMVTS